MNTFPRPRDSQGICAMGESVALLMVTWTLGRGDINSI